MTVEQKPGGDKDDINMARLTSLGNASLLLCTTAGMRRQQALCGNTNLLLARY